MANRIVLFEDSRVHQLTPLILTRPTFDLLCGVHRLSEKARQTYPQAEPAYWVRDELAALTAAQTPKALVNTKINQPALFLNARVLWDPALAEFIPMEGEDRLYTHNATLVAARLSAAESAQLNPAQALTADSLNHLPRREVRVNEIQYFWDLIHENPTQLQNDYKALGGNGAKDGRVHHGAHLLNEAQITIAQKAEVMPTAVLDAQHGPILIDESARIQPHTYIEGPCYIGKNSLVKVGASIYHGCTFGEVCKIGGEIESSIILPYSNKQHKGFLGHAYLGQWVNIGADTNNSDLKNDYGPVKCIVHNELINTHSQFVGMAMGDHSRTGINTMFNTGSIVGVGCNIFGVGYPPKTIPSFTWGGAEAMVEYRLDKFLEAVRRVMQRRLKELSPEEEALFIHLHKLTEDERDRARIMNRMRTS